MPVTMDVSVYRWVKSFIIFNLYNFPYLNIILLNYCPKRHAFEPINRDMCDIRVRRHVWFFGIIEQMEFPMWFSCLRVHKNWDHVFGRRRTKYWVLQILDRILCWILDKLMHHKHSDQLMVVADGDCKIFKHLFYVYSVKLHTYMHTKDVYNLLMHEHTYIYIHTNGVIYSNLCKQRIRYCF